MMRLVTGHGDAATFGLLFALEEIGANCTLETLDLNAFAQWSEAHRTLSPDGAPVVLEAPGLVLDHPLLSLFYLAEIAPDAGLLPHTPAERYLVEAIATRLDRQIAPNLSYLGWLAEVPSAKREDYLERLAAHPRRPTLAGWSAVWRDAVPSERRVDHARSKILACLKRINTCLRARDWLVGQHFSIADMTGFALLRRFSALVPDASEFAVESPLSAWLSRVAERPAATRAQRRLVEAALDGIFCPPVFE